MEIFTKNAYLEELVRCLPVGLKSKGFRFMHFMGVYAYILMKNNEK